MFHTVKNTYRNLFGGNVNLETLVYYMFIRNIILKYFFIFYLHHIMSIFKLSVKNPLFKRKFKPFVLPYCITYQRKA